MVRSLPETTFIGHAMAWWTNISADAVTDPRAPDFADYPAGPVKPVGLTDRLLTECPNLYGDLSARSGYFGLHRDPGFTRDFLKRHRARLLWGTDCPCVDGRGNLQDGSSRALPRRGHAAAAARRLRVGGPLRRHHAQQRGGPYRSAGDVRGISMPTHQILRPQGVHPPAGKYSHAARVEGGSLLVVAGQVAVDTGGELVGQGDVAAQTRQVFRNLEGVLEAAGGSFADVIEFTYYIVGRGNVAGFIEARTAIFDEAYPEGVYPPATLLVVGGLANEDFLVEVSALAAVS